MQHIKVYGYIRKSPDDTESTDTSMKNQTKLINDFCTKRGWFVEKIFADKNISGGDRSRKGFNDMLNSILKNEEIKIIVVKEQDRFARDSAFFTDTLRDLDAHGIRVFSIMKNNFLSYEDLGDVVTSVVDAHYIITQRKKANVLFEQKKSEGLAPIKAPFGYKNKNGGWVVNKKKADIVRQVCNDYLNKVNFKETMKRLKINKSLYYRILKNARKGLYNGFVNYMRKIRDSNKKVIKEEEIKYKGRHEALISDEVFRAVNSSA